MPALVSPFHGRNPSLVSHGSPPPPPPPSPLGISLPERPDKKASTKIQREKVEKFLLYLVATPSLQSSELVVEFLKPDDGFGTVVGNSETVSAGLNTRGAKSCKSK